jgi:hypothetical protein
MVLFAILAVMIVALIYEYGFVRRSYKAAEVAVDDFVDQRTGDVVTPSLVRATLAKEPVGGLQDKGDYLLEHYQWTRWLPWKTYDIYVVYEQTDPPQFFNSTRPNPPGPGELPTVFDMSYVEPGGPGPGVPGGPPAESPGRQRPTAEDEGQVAEGEEGASAARDPAALPAASDEDGKTPEADPAGESPDAPKTEAAPATESDGEEGKTPEAPAEPAASEESEADAAPAAKDDPEIKTSDENE